MFAPTGLTGNYSKLASYPTGKRDYNTPLHATAIAENYTRTTKPKMVDLVALEHKKKIIDEVKIAMNDSAVMFCVN